MNLNNNDVIIAMMKRFYALIFFICCPLGGIADNVQDNLPELGDVSATVLSPLEEQAIASQIMRDVMSSNQVVRDPEINDYITNLGYRLAANGPDKRQTFNFFVVQDNSINAFAMPGGVIGVHTGLMLAANNESELASVLGHEIGHVVQRHLARMMAQQKTDRFINIAGFALAILASRSNTQLATGAMTAATATGIQRQLDYTREHEREADRVGLQILDSAGFDVHAMPEFFNTLLKSSRFVDGAAPSFLRTHPLTTERISDVKNRVDNMSYKQTVDSLEFQLNRAKLRAGFGAAETAVAYFKQNIDEKRYANQVAEYYGLAIAQMRSRDFESATKTLRWINQNAAKHPYIETLHAKLEVAKNKPQEAAKIFLAGLKAYPNHRALIHGYAEHLVALQQWQELIKLIEDKQSLYPDDPVLYEIKSKAYHALNQHLLAHQAQAEAQYRRYNLEKSIEQMELAIKANDGDFYQQSIVEARLKVLKQQMNEPKKKGLFE